MPVSFPNSPSDGQTLTTNTGIRYTYSSAKGRWDATTGYTTQSDLDKYLQVANSTSFAATSLLNDYLQVANVQPLLDNYLQVANSSSAGTNTSVVYTYANFLGG